MSDSALLELTADSNALLGTAHDLRALRTAHASKLAHLDARQQHLQQQRERESIQQRHAHARTQLLRSAGLHAEVTGHPDVIDRTGDWSREERDGVAESIARHREGRAKRRRVCSSDALEDDDDGGGLQFSDCYALAVRMGRPVTELLRQALPSVASSSSSPPPSSSLSLEQSDAFAAHIAAQFAHSYRPPPPPLLPPPSYAAFPRAERVSRSSLHRSHLWNIILGDSADEEDEEDEDQDQDGDVDDGSEAVSEDGDGEDEPGKGEELDGSSSDEEYDDDGGGHELPQRPPRPRDGSPARMNGAAETNGHGHSQKRHAASDSDSSEEVPLSQRWRQKQRHDGH